MSVWKVGLAHFSLCWGSSVEGRQGVLLPKQGIISQMAGLRGANTELMVAIRGLSAARDLPPEVILDALRAALVSAYHKIPGADESQVTVDIDQNTGESRVLAHYTVVDEQFIEDPHSELTVEQAREIRPGASIGDTISIDVTPDDFGRIAAQTAKQVILQRIREAEREQTYTTYADREGEIVYGTVQTANRDHITVALDRVEALLPKSQQIPGERYAPNQRLRVYVAEVKRSPKGPQVIVSRTHREMLRQLMELEIPEIFQGIVESKAIAREAGSRSKVAVWSHQEGVDPVGACVGMRGVRIQALVRELGGEKIDIVQWDPDPRVFIANALSPASVRHVWLEEGDERRTANVIVPDNQLSLAIGREGQNARLAAKLTGWRIDIRAESEAEDVLDELKAADEAMQRTLAREEPEAAAPAEEADEGLAPAAEADVPVEEIGAAEAPVEAEAEAEIEAEPGVAVEAEPEPEAAPMAAQADLAPAEAEAEPEPELLETKPEVAELAAEATEVEQPEAAPLEADEKPEAEPSEETEPAPAQPLGVQDEDLDPDTAHRRKREHRRLIRDPVTGELVAEQRRKRSRRRPDWEEDLGRWSEDDLFDMMDFTEEDFLGTDAEEAEEDAEDEVPVYSTEAEAPEATEGEPAQDDDAGQPEDDDEPTGETEAPSVEAEESGQRRSAEDDEESAGADEQG